jgi:RNA polymerase sigma-70 factor (ECF subfamily)
MALESTIARFLDAKDFEAAASAIVRGYGPEILGYLAALARDPDRAHDVFSQVCEDIWRGLPDFRREASARTWLYKLAWRAWLRHERDAFRRHGRPLVTEQMSRLAAEVRSTTALHLRTDVKDAVARLREKLTPDEKSLLVLRIDRDLPWAEIASIMSSPGHEVAPLALAKRFERVKTKLRRFAEEAGLLGRE